MHVHVPVLRRCCFCFPLRYCIELLACLRLLATGIVLPFFTMLSLLFLAFAYKEHVEHCFLILTIIIMVIDVVFDIILIVATHKKSVSMLQLYCAYGLFYGAAVLVLSLAWVSYEIGADKFDLHNARTRKNLLLISCLVTVILLVHTYFLILIKSEVVKLKSGSEFRLMNLTAAPECSMQPTNEGEVV